MKVKVHRLRKSTEKGDIKKGEKLLYEGMGKLVEAESFLNCPKCRKEITNVINSLSEVVAKIGFWQSIKNEKKH